MTIHTETNDLDCGPSPFGGGTNCSPFCRHGIKRQAARDAARAANAATAAAASRTALGDGEYPSGRDEALDWGGDLPFEEALEALKALKVRGAFSVQGRPHGRNGAEVPSLFEGKMMREVGGGWRVERTIQALSSGWVRLPFVERL